MTRRRSIRLTPAMIAALLATTVGLAACGPEELPASPTPTVEPVPTTTVTTYQLDTTVWYAGLVLTIRTVTAELDARGGSAQLAATVDNPGADDRSFDVPIAITAGGQGFEPARGTSQPIIPAGGSVDLTIEFDVISRASLDDAVVRIGPSAEHQALVPLREGPVQTVTLEPVDIDATGVGTAGDLRVTLTSGELRWDLPDWADELPNPSAALTLTYDAAFRGSFIGGFAFTGDNVALRLPNGTTIGPRQDGHSQSIALIGAGQTARNLSSRFEIPSNLFGSYTLVVTNGSASATISFTVSM
jgi:hypothetical protein